MDKAWAECLGGDGTDCFFLLRIRAHERYNVKFYDFSDKRAEKAISTHRNVFVGGDAPVVVQSMTNTDTADVKGTVEQTLALARAGSEIVRVTVNNEASARAVPAIVEALRKQDCDVPIVGDFHYNGHRLLNDFPDCAKALGKYRINPGNVGFADKHDAQFAQMIECALKYEKPVRIGVNWGSPRSADAGATDGRERQIARTQKRREISRDALVLSALESAKHAEKLGLGADRIVISCKVSACRI